MSEFTSFLSPFIVEFTAYRRVSGNWCDFYERMIWRFERYCVKNYPNAECLTQKMVDSWCKQHADEKNNSCRARIYAIVNMVRYLRQRGQTDVKEPDIPLKERVSFVPHLFTQDELKDFSRACDSVPKETHCKKNRPRKLIIPVFFRLLYSSGMRPIEARKLLVTDVDLQNGILSIKNSKGRRNQHFVALHDSMLALMRKYDAAMQEICPSRIYFFPSPSGSFLSGDWAATNFNKLWDRENKPCATTYAFRHNYSISNINSWVDEGFGFDSKFLYLSKSMGHYDIESTKYYYSLTPSFADLLEEKTNADFESIVPEVEYEDV